MSHTGRNIVEGKILQKYEGMPASMAQDREAEESEEEVHWIEWCVHCPHFHNGCHWPAPWVTNEPMNDCSECEKQ